MYSIVPKSSLVLMNSVYRRIFPQVHNELAFWKERAERIPNQELQRQALASIDSKKFHCQGGAVYSVLAADKWQEAIRFIVAYQTISDYLDNLCDRSTSLDPEDFRLLHQSMEDALSPDNSIKNYYALRAEQNDGEYLSDLVRTCQTCLKNLKGYEWIKPYLIQLERLYSDLQVHKHVEKEDRLPRLQQWYEKYQHKWPSLSWYEFSASSGSTLGIFCLVSYSLGGNMSGQLAEEIFESYFPFMQGLHILLDYYIDQKEDLMEGDLNFCNYYNDQDHMKKRLLYFINQTNKQVQHLPNKQFHEMVHNGLVGLYLADCKVKQLDGANQFTKALLNESGSRAKFFHFNAKMYHKLTK